MTAETVVPSSTYRWKCVGFESDGDGELPVAVVHGYEGLHRYFKLQQRVTTTGGKAKWVDVQSAPSGSIDGPPGGSSIWPTLPARAVQPVETVEDLGLTPRQRELFDCLKELRDAEWMVTHDWGGDREKILGRVDKALRRCAKAYGLDAGKFANAESKEPTP